MDVGWGELVLLAVLAIFIFGPEKLPKAAADAGRMVRKLRELAQGAQRDIQGHGIDVEGIKNDLRGVADLHPKRIIGAALADPKPNPAPAATNAMPRQDQDSAPTSQPPVPPTTPRLDPDAT